MITANNAVDILLVEDSALEAELALAALKARNMADKVVHLLDGDQVLDFVCANSWSADWQGGSAPKVILLDLNLARMGGLEVLQQLKVRERTRRIPVVIFTGALDQKEMIESYRLGVNSYVIKPTDPKFYAQLVGDIAYYWLMVNQTFH